MSISFENRGILASVCMLVDPVLLLSSKLAAFAENIGNLHYPLHSELTRWYAAILFTSRDVS